jgi:hypothetical protein
MARTVPSGGREWGRGGKRLIMAPCCFYERLVNGPSSAAVAKALPLYGKNLSAQSSNARSQES